MAEENQVTKEPQQVQQEPQQVTKEQQRVTTKDPKKVEAGKRLAAINCKMREEQVQLEKTARWGFASGVNQYYGIGAVIAVGVIGGLGYYIYRTKKGGATAGQGASTSGEQPSNPQQNNPKPRPQTNKFEMD